MKKKLNRVIALVMVLAACRAGADSSIPAVSSAPAAGSETGVLAAGAKLEKLAGGFGTPDGKRLYVSDIDSKKTWSYAMASDGSLSEKRLFCAMGSDGMTIDDAGNVYLTGDGVTVFNSSGRQILHLKVPEAWTGNICFGGKDRHLLFITATTGIYGIRTKTRGVGSQ